MLDLVFSAEPGGSHTSEDSKAFSDSKTQLLPLPKIAVSGCLVGQKVRYNGAAKTNQWVADQLSQHTQISTFCPEMAMGLGAPRESMRLIRNGDGGISLIGNESSTDYTELALEKISHLVKSFPKDMDAFVLTSKSPTCGPEMVKVYDANGIPSSDGEGLFAAALRVAFPRAIVIDSGRLHDRDQRMLFLMRLYTLRRFKSFSDSVSGLQNFHQRHKFLLSGFNNKLFRELGRIAASTFESFEHQSECYHDKLLELLSSTLNRGAVSDSLMHLYSFLKRDLGEVQKKSILELIDQFRLGHVGINTPLSILWYSNKLVGSNYMNGQFLFYPFPFELTQDVSNRKMSVVNERSRA